jgi:site-specific recombinase XerD
MQEFSTEAWLKAQAEEFKSRALAKNTVRGYEADWTSFSGWCAERGYISLPADANTLAIYNIWWTARDL